MWSAERRIKITELKMRKSKTPTQTVFFIRLNNQSQQSGEKGAKGSDGNARLVAPLQGAIFQTMNTRGYAKPHPGLMGGTPLAWKTSRRDSHHFLLHPGENPPARARYSRQFFTMKTPKMYQKNKYKSFSL